MSITEKIAKMIDGSKNFRGLDVSIMECINFSYPFQYDDAVYMAIEDADGTVLLYTIYDLDYDDWMNDAIDFENESRADDNDYIPIKYEDFDLLTLMDKVRIITSYESVENLDAYPESFDNILEVLIYLKDFKNK